MTSEAIDARRAWPRGGLASAPAMPAVDVLPLALRGWVALPAYTGGMSDNPCLSCGACCMSFRVDFDRSELQSEGGHVPDGLAVELTGRLVRMRGTDHAQPRCAAFTGRVGVKASCGIHEWRPSPCREFGERAPMGIGDEACDRARTRHGLAPIQQ